MKTFIAFIIFISISGPAFAASKLGHKQNVSIDFNTMIQDENKRSDQLQVEFDSLSSDPEIAEFFQEEISHDSESVVINE